MPAEAAASQGSSQLQEWSRATEAELASLGATVSPRPGDFLPVAQYEGMRICRKAAIESTHRYWLAHRQLHQKHCEDRSVQGKADGYRATHRIMCDSARHSLSLSARERRRMVKNCAFEAGHEERQQRFNSDVSSQERQMVQVRAEARGLSDVNRIEGFAKTSDVVARAGQVQRELESKQVKQIEEIAQHCRRHRPVPPLSPHTARVHWSKWGPPGGGAPWSSTRPARRSAETAALQTSAS